MKFRSVSLRYGPGFCWLLLLLIAFLAACGVISPRRIVTNNPSPTPTPSPGTTPTPTPTATPTPTPTPAGTTAQAQFLFAANPATSQLLGFEINADGGLSPVAGFPVELADSPRLVAASGDNLLVAGNKTLTAFVVNKETGALSKLDVIGVPMVSNLTLDGSSGTALAATANGEFAIRVVNNRLQTTPVSESRLTAEATTAHRAAMDGTRKFFYVLDSGTGMLSAFQLQEGKPVPLSRPSYAMGQGASSITIAVP